MVEYYVLRERTDKSFHVFFVFFPHIKQKVPVNQRAEAANSIYYEAHCRIKDPVYGCAGIITMLNQQIYDAQCQLSKIQAEIAVLNGNHAEIVPPYEPPSFANYSAEGNGTFSSADDPSTPQFY